MSEKMHIVIRDLHSAGGFCGIQCEVVEGFRNKREALEAVREYRKESLAAEGPITYDDFRFEKPRRKDGIAYGYVEDGETVLSEECNWRAFPCWSYEQVDEIEEREAAKAR